jgi:hypothetical protein
MVVDLFQHLHDEYIAATESKYHELWYSTDAANSNSSDYFYCHSLVDWQPTPWDPTPCEDEIPF